MIGKPEGRWTETVDTNVKKITLKFKNWRRSAEDRDARRRRTEKAKIQFGL
jgi:hypothetical protein